MKKKSFFKACLLLSMAAAAVTFTSCGTDDDSNDGNDDGNGVAVTGITLDKSALALTIGDAYTLTATVTPADATDKTVSWSSSDTTKATVDAAGKLTALAEGAATITATAGSKTATCALTITKGVVINGVMWATRNVDAPGTFAATPEAAGMFYQWNRKVAYPGTGTVSSWDTGTPSGTTWEKSNDPSPAGWRIPTITEVDKLRDATKVTSVWITQNGVSGRKFTDKTSGASVFFPAVGFRAYKTGALNNAGTYGFYWSSTEGSSDDAYNLTFYSDEALQGFDKRCYGNTIRCVVAE